MNLSCDLTWLWPEGGSQHLESVSPPVALLIAHICCTSFVIASILAAGGSPSLMK